MADEISLEEQLDDLDNDIQDLQDDVALSDYKQRIAELDKEIDDLSVEIEQLRSRGYRFKGYLEGKVAAIKRKWISAKPAMQREITQGEKELEPLNDEVVKKVSNLQRVSSGTQLKRELGALESKVRHLEARVSAVGSAISATYQSVQEALHQTQAQLREAFWLLDEIDQASFDLLAGENAVQGVKAKWWRDGKKKGPEGNLYLTDQRLIFEQKEEVATKKILFITTDKEMVQEMLFASPVGSVEFAKSSSKGLFGHEDHLDFTFGSGVDYANAHFHIDGQDSDFWAGLIKRVSNGDIRGERFYAEGETPDADAVALEESLADVPEKCSACGAPFDAPVAKGQRQIQCEYCGTTMRW